MERLTMVERDPTTYRILGAYFGVYRELGWGFLESVYQRSMLVALQRMGLRAAREVPIPVRFSGVLVGAFKADLVVEERVIVELKTVERLDRIHRAQLLNYLKATPIEVGLLLNFGPRPAYERLLFTNDRKQPQPLQF